MFVPQGPVKNLKEFKDKYMMDEHNVISNGLAKVYTGYMRSNRTPVIFKHINNSKVDVKKSNHEASILQSLKHQNVIKLYDHYQNSTESLMCMERCKHTLRSQANGDISDENMFKYCKQIADAMEYIHSQGVLHLDLKPENILIAQNDDIRIIDFGESVKKSQKYQTRVCRRATPKYCCPELLRDQNKLSELRPDQKFDVWAYGLIVYQMAFKKQFFNKQNMATILQQLQSFAKNRECKIPPKGAELSILELLKMTLQIDPKQRKQFSEIKKYIQSKSQFSTGTDTGNKKVHPNIKRIYQIGQNTINLRTLQMFEKKRKDQNDQRRATLIGLYKQFLDRRIAFLEELLVSLCLKTQEIQKLISHIGKYSMTILKICVYAMQYQLHYKLYCITQNMEIVLPTESIAIDNITNLFKVQYIKPVFVDITKSCEEYTRKVQKVFQEYLKIILERENFRTNFKDFFQAFTAPRDSVFSNFSLQNPQNYIREIVRKQAMLIDEQSYSHPILSVLYRCSIVCSFQRNLPSKNFQAKRDHTKVMDSLQTYTRQQMIKETLYNLLYKEAQS